jgi:glycosyltransferase involved in cell wall biosynthesis
MEYTIKQKPLLVLLPSLKASQDSDGQQFVTQKFIDGVTLYKKFWPGDITILIEKNLHPDDNLDHVNVNNIESAALTVTNFDNIEGTISLFNKNTIILAGIHYRQNSIASLCQKHHIPCVQTSEYTLKTRLQIVKTNKRNLLRRWRTYLWEYLQEKKNHLSIQLSSGVQCNGLPTYLAYKDTNDNCLLYFDSRVHQQDVISADALAKRTAYYQQNQPLRLLFSGRLNAMKGADHLLLFAKALDELNVNFTLTICGDGELANSMHHTINKLNLDNRVTMTGVLNFQDELLPLVKSKTDLFICCHRQGDPSCTYLETMSCGVPIIAYDNEAFSGLNNISKCGWEVPMNRYDLMAKKVQSLSTNREEIAAFSEKARKFSLKHTFEKTFEKRIEHLLKLVD